MTIEPIVGYCVCTVNLAPPYPLPACAGIDEVTLTPFTCSLTIRSTKSISISSAVST